MSERTETTKLVNGLIEKNIDASKGFNQAAENTSNLALKNYLKVQANQREQFANNLTTELRSFDPSAAIEETGSLQGDLHRGWMDIKAAFSNETDEAILEECIRGDKASLEEYHEVLETRKAIPPSIAQLIRDQHQDVHSTVSQVSQLEDLV